MENTSVQKKTFNIELRNIKDMEFFLAPRKQTAFVNQAIRQSLDQMTKEKNKQEALQALQDLSQMTTKDSKRTTVKSDEKSSVELIRELRQGRVEHLCGVVDTHST